jgi:hypothetical protein
MLFSTWRSASIGGCFGGLLLFRLPGRAGRPDQEQRMSRSRRRTPIVGMTTAESDKPFKVAEHRRERRIVRSAIKAGDDSPTVRLFGNPWASDKDGKQWLGDRHPDLMRK